MEYEIKVKELKGWNSFIWKANMRIGKIASSAEYRMDEQFQNCEFSEPNFDFRNWKKSRNFLIFQIGKI